MDLTQPVMPMGQQARLPLDMSAIMPTVTPPMAGAPMPPAAAGLMEAPGFPPPDAPLEPPYQVEMQPDGSSVYFIPGPDGTRATGITLGVNKAPKLPPALQPPSGKGA